MKIKILACLTLSAATLHSISIASSIGPWTIYKIKDSMTDENRNMAISSTGSHKLVLQCVNGRLGLAFDGDRYMTPNVSYMDYKLQWRFDNKKASNFTSYIVAANKPAAIISEIDTKKFIKEAKTSRSVNVKIMEYDGGYFILKFNVEKMSGAASALGCK